MAQTANTSSSRATALARRKAMSTTGKAGIAPAGTTRATATSSAPSAPSTAVRGTPRPASSGPVGRSASRARREAMSTRGKAATASGDRTRNAPAKAAPATQAPEQKSGGCGCGCNGDPAKRKEGCGGERAAAPAQTPQARIGNGHKVRSRTPVVPKSSSRATSLARRQAQSSRGKAGISPNGMSAAQTARAANPQMSGRELAQALRSQRSRQGGAGTKKSEPCGRVRPNKATATGAAQDAPWKVGAGETGQGQTVTGTMVGRSHRTTGDEYGTCRSVTGTEYMGADIFRNFCQAEPAKGPRKVGLSPTGRGNRVTGNEVGRSGKVTGDEPGTCKRVTGTEYVGANQMEAFCGTRPEPGPAKISASETRKGRTVTGNNVGRSENVTGDEPGSGRQLTGSQYMQTGNGKAPAKVGQSNTLSGGFVTGTMTGRSERVTGDEPGTCRSITGDEYIGQEQYSGFCEKVPQPQDRKVGLSRTLKGETVTGTMTGRSERVTGDEPGTCKAITGTPYAGAEQYRSYCKPEDANLAEVRTRPQRSTPGSVMTGQQPGIGGQLTGAAKGACEPLTGTPYVGADQFADACPATAAEPGSPDFPQLLGDAPWGGFSVNAPSHAARGSGIHEAVTGSHYEQGQITGPFGMATGKVTGTEEARFGHDSSVAAPAPIPATAETVDGRVKYRVTGEGMEAGHRITGDDWDRGDRVTGTEGATAKGRNPTRRGPMGAMAPQQPKRNEELPAPVSKVTGGSGNTEKGSLVTYSGGARG